MVMLNNLMSYNYQVNRNKHSLKLLDKSSFKNYQRKRNIVIADLEKNAKKDKKDIKNAERDETEI